MHTDRAILLRKIKLSETSLIVSWLTASHGRVKTVAKGARQPKSKFSGRLDLFFECEMQWSPSRTGDLHTLREVGVIEPHAELRTDFERVTLAAYFVELIELVTEPEHGMPEIFDLVRRGFSYLHGHPASMRALEHFEKELVRLLGIEHPTVSAAVALGRAYHRIPPSRAGLVKRLRE